MNCRLLLLKLLALAVILPAGIMPAAALVAIISPGERQIYLQVGDGSYNTNSVQRDHKRGATPAVNTRINKVEVAVPASELGNGKKQTMRSDSLAEISFFDGFQTCDATLGEVYIGAWWRIPSESNETSVATLSIRAPHALTSASNHIPFAKIRWDSTALGDDTAHIAAGSFADVQTTTINPKTWVENCHVFHYVNDELVPAGTYTGRVTYTLSTP